MKYYAFFAIMMVKFEIENGESDEGEDRFWVCVVPSAFKFKKKKEDKGQTVG